MIPDIYDGDLANAECRVEMQEMNGDENPFTTRLAVLDQYR